jgi:hypothetical protein
MQAARKEVFPNSAQFRTVIRNSSIQLYGSPYSRTDITIQIRTVCTAVLYSKELLFLGFFSVSLPIKQRVEAQVQCDFSNHTVLSFGQRGEVFM